jgi:ubiquitin-hydrolase Zn-finger-containing protein
MSSDGSRFAADVHAPSLNGSAPRCEHLDVLTPAPPLGSVCPECHAAGENWTSLFACLTCGWVGCSNDSPRRHARAHYEETDHPLACALRPGPVWRWCFVHERAV